MIRTFLMRDIFCSVLVVLVAGLATAVKADLLLQYTFDEDSSGTAPALDNGAPPPALGSFEGGALRTGNTPGGMSLGAADLSDANAYVTAPIQINSTAYDR